MQFVRNGPDIPERLLQAHEEGRVVFFCGAGISYPAGLPSFDGLVGKIYEELGHSPNAIQQAAIKAGQFDTVIGLLEAEIVGGRKTVRQKMVKILTPDLSVPNAKTTHEALLTLAKDRDGRSRLITTNFDRLFEETIVTEGLTIKRFQAPFLRIPKNRWDGLVYLHGLLSSVPTSSDLDDLVVSSGDFGLAYLTERWAARFVSELFRNYTVCFVGYSINDPVLRYMMDALAADRLLGESPPEMFAFGSYSKGKEDERANEWRAKNVTPILYREHNRHSYLHKTLRRWAETYRDGVRGKERIVVECAMAKPLASTMQDDFVGRMLWALSDTKGVPAKRFADFDPVPSLDWLEPLCEERYRHTDLGRFGVSPKVKKDEKLAFSLTSRPIPYDLSPRMALVDAGAAASRWDEVMYHLARWLVRHLDDPKLVLWLAKRGGQLHEDFSRCVKCCLEELNKLEFDGKYDELDRIRLNAPYAIPRPMMRTLWRVILSGRLKTYIHRSNIIGWLGRLKREGLTTILRFELREALTPRVKLREPFRWGKDNDEPVEPARIKDLVEWEIVLTADYVHSTLQDWSDNLHWKKALPDLLNEFSALLRDTLDLMRELGGVDDRNDLSYLHQSSISKHPQNKDFHDWTALIDLSRDAWLATAERSIERARLAAEGWWQVPYPLFKRMAYFAAARGNVISTRQALDWLLADAHWWLWAVETQREAMRLLVAIAPTLDLVALAELEQAILDGPPRAMFKNDIEAERWTQLVDREIWLRLAKTEAAGARLGRVSKAKLVALAAQNTQWQLAVDESDEFPFWMSDGNEMRKFNATPRRRRELVDWLKQHPSTDHRQEDDWRQRCRDNFATASCALLALAQEGIWPADRWREALQAWSEDKLHIRSWRYMAPVLIKAPGDKFQSLDQGISWWLQAIAKTFEKHEDIFFKLCRHILAIDSQHIQDINDPVMQAINHPVGHVTEGLLGWWYRRSLRDGQGLSEKLKPIFTELCDTQIDKFHHGRIVLATHIIALYRVDPEWATMHILPLFDWNRSSSEARSAWKGFLWSPRLYKPLMEAMEISFLDTAKHYESLGEHNGQYAALLTFAALDQGDTFSIAEFTAATRALPADGLRDAAQALVRSLESAGDQRAEYWNHRVQPYLEKIWPKSREKNPPEVSEKLAMLCVAAQEAFPEAFKVLQNWLQSLAHPDYLMSRLYEAGLCKNERFSAEVLGFLSIVIGDEARSPSTHLKNYLKNCLKDIEKANPQLAADNRYQRLWSLVNPG